LAKQQQELQDCHYTDAQGLLSIMSNLDIQLHCDVVCSDRSV